MPAVDKTVDSKDVDQSISPLAGKPAPEEALINVEKLLEQYSTILPDPEDPLQRVSFGTSGHRGSSANGSFNENHILAVSQAVADYRSSHGINGPLYMGRDTHLLSAPAQRTALEVLAANGVEVQIAREDGDGQYAPTPAVSHAILCHNRQGGAGQADGIIITPSHNPPSDGGFKYNPPSGGPAEPEITRWIQDRANELLAAGNQGVKRIPYERALKESTTHFFDFVIPYVRDLGSIVDMDVIRSSGIRIAVDPLGSANVGYWKPIIEQYGLQLEVVNSSVDPTFRFMPVDWDGKIRMDCSSPHAMANLVGLKDRFDIAFGNDTDSDRHGIVTPSTGLMNPNHFLAVAIHYLYTQRDRWPADCAIGKTIVSSSLIDRVAVDLGRTLCEVPVGFKWFVQGLLDGSMGFGGEESAGASFLRRDGTVWTTDKDGIIMDLLAAEITARTGRDPGRHHEELTRRLGSSHYTRIDSPATRDQKARLGRLSPSDVKATSLAGEEILARLTRAPGNDAPIGGLKVVTQNGWFAARPSGTEDVYKVYAESFRGPEHLDLILEEAQKIVLDTIR